MSKDKPRSKPCHQIAALVTALQSFPPNLELELHTGLILFKPGGWGMIEHNTGRGFVAKHTERTKEWAATVFSDDAGKILQWLREHPKETEVIAFAAIAGLFLDDADERALPEDDSYPRGSGSDYVDHVGGVLESVGIMPLIKKMQFAAECACRECGAPADDGEGYDGMCGNCADIAENDNT